MDRHPKRVEHIHMDKNQQYVDALAEELAVALTRAHMTNRDLAKVTGLHENTVGRYVSGKRDIPVSVMAVLCRALGVDVGDLDAKAWAKVGK
jgi:DNA-binding Xre family transcriptional regulator